MSAAIQFPEQADGWSRRRAKKAARLARLAPWMKGLVLETGAMVEALQTLLEPVGPGLPSGSQLGDTR